MSFVTGDVFFVLDVSGPQIALSLPPVAVGKIISVSQGLKRGGEFSKDLVISQPHFAPLPTFLGVRKVWGKSLASWASSIKGIP